MSTLIKAEVRKEWALSLRQVVDDLNYPPDQKLPHKITFANLGGLAIWFWDEKEVFGEDPDLAREEQAYLFRSRSVINLCEEVVPMLVTCTSRILAATHEKNGEYAPLAKQLERRMNPPMPQGYDLNDVDVTPRPLYRRDETWFFPAHQLVPVDELVVSDNTDFLFES